MSARRRILLAIAVVFTLVNVGGLVAAGIAREVLHATVHAALTVPGALAVGALAQRRSRVLR